jgi:hypothetical protein
MLEQRRPNLQRDRRLGRGKRLPRRLLQRRRRLRGVRQRRQAVLEQRRPNLQRGGRLEQRGFVR